MSVKTAGKNGTPAKSATPKRAASKPATPDKAVTPRKAVALSKAGTPKKLKPQRAVRCNYVDDEAVDVIVDDQKTKRNNLQQQECLADEDQEALDVSTS